MRLIEFLQKLHHRRVIGTRVYYSDPRDGPLELVAELTLAPPEMRDVAVLVMLNPADASRQTFEAKTETLVLRGPAVPVMLAEVQIVQGQPAAGPAVTAIVDQRGGTEELPPPRQVREVIETRTAFANSAGQLFIGPPHCPDDEHEDPDHTGLCIHCQKVLDEPQTPPSKAE